MSQTRLFRFQIGEQQLEVIRADGSEDRESKTKILDRIQTFIEAEKNKGTPWRDLVAPFLVEDSPASQALLGTSDYATWKEVFLEINEVLNTDCTNHFGTLVQQLSVRSSPFELNGCIYNETRALEKLVHKKLGGLVTAQGNYDGGLSEDTKKIVTTTLEVVARDQFTSIVYPAKDYTGSTKFKEATRTQVVTFYNNLAVSNNSSLSLSCTNGSFDKRWSRKKEALEDERGKSSEDRAKKSQKNNNKDLKDDKEETSLKRKRLEQPEKKKTDGCFYCEKKGHIARDCKKKKADLKNKEAAGADKKK